ncbi:lipopolysaccharide biosynthesis protein, partial [Streptomyces sp. SID3212]|nr:lipopolysaccharide biosynthesis protein [Streptomyces sp. SID3212]
RREGPGGGPVRPDDGYGTNWARERAYPDGAYHHVRHRAHHPVDHPMGRPSVSPSRAREREERWITLLWLLLGLAAGLFWSPLARVVPLGQDPLTGRELFDALPPLTLAGGVLLIVVQCAAASLVRPRPVLLGTGLLISFASLHAAPPLLGVRPERASGPWHGPVVEVLVEVGGGRFGRDDVLRALPVALQLLCLGLAAVTLWAVRADGRVTAGVLWVLVITGWAAQRPFAAAPVPVFVGLVGVAGAALAVRLAPLVRRYRGGSG